MIISGIILTYLFLGFLSTFIIVRFGLFVPIYEDEAKIVFLVTMLVIWPFMIAAIVIERICRYLGSIAMRFAGIYDWMDKNSQEKEKQNKANPSED